MSLKIKETTPDHALQDYLDRIFIVSHSQASVKAYRTAIIGEKNGFRIFLKEKYNCNEIQLRTRIQNQELDVYNILNEYVIFLDKQGLKPKSMRLWFSTVKGYLTHLQVEVFSEKCKQRIKLPKVRRVKKEALTKEIIIKLLRNLDAKLETAILVAISSGMRVGEIGGLKLSDIEFNHDPVKINIRAETSKQLDTALNLVSQKQGNSKSSVVNSALTYYFKNQFPEDFPKSELEILEDVKQEYLHKQTLETYQRIQIELVMHLIWKKV